MSANPLSGVTTYLTNDEWLIASLPATAASSVSLPDNWCNYEAIFEIIIKHGTGYNKFVVYNPAAKADVPIEIGGSSTVAAGTNSADLAYATSAGSTANTFYVVKPAASGLLSISNGAITAASQVFVRRTLVQTPPA